MRAAIHERYGPPEVMRVGEVERPEPADAEVLVEVHASTVTRGDTDLRSLEYPFSRLFTGVRAPKRTVAGTEFAGRVVEMGAAVTELDVGDEVFGLEGGANAEFLTVRESGVIAPKPAALTYEQAAAIPDGALLALTMLRPVSPQGKRVLVYGAAGSIGTAAVQLLAHYFEAEVTAVCDGNDLELVRSLGAHEALDRFAEDFTRGGGRRYDVVFDAVGRHSFRRCRHALEPGGLYLTTTLGFLYHVPFAALATRVVGSRRARLGIGRYTKEDLLLVKELVEAGKYRPVVDRMYALDEIVEASRYVETGQKTGNVVVRVRAPGSRE